MTPETWKKAKPLLERALKHQNTHTIDNVKQAIIENKAQLWCGEKSVIVTEILQHPAKAECRIWLAAGNKEELVSVMLKDVESWAKGGGCRNISIVGRKGWMRVLKDYYQPHTVLEKELR